jgi:D-serine deaminase-like pyridoxal phosphate-dependent protein
MARPLSKWDVETPALLADLDKVKRNIQDMQKAADEAGVALRPHVKTHKCSRLAHLQLEAGAQGICVQKVGEAEVMASAGIRDIFITYEVVGEAKQQRVAQLAQDIKIAINIDDPQVAETMAHIAREAGVEVGAFIEVDSGLHRCGIPPEEERVVELARHISRLEGLVLRGITTYEGHVYKLKTGEERAREVPRILAPVVRVAEAVRRAGMECEVVSVGSTPSAKHAARVPGVTEIQPGNYIFYDLIQVERQVCPLEWCAQTVVSTIISKPADDRAVIDGGIKTFCHDQCIFPKVISVEGAELVSFSEEHGVLRLQGEATRLRVGDKVELIPYHACTASNMHNQFYVVRGERVEAVWPIDAKGTLQ